MDGRKSARGLLGAVFLAALAGPLAIGCSDDDEGADCSDSGRSVDAASLEFSDAC